jgi:predicted  nucleic acid-binding Zn-ribbon protein
MPSNPSIQHRTDREALELLMQHAQRLLEQFERLKSEQEGVVQRARAAAENVVRLQGEVDALKVERNELKTALEAQAASSATDRIESNSTYSQPDPTTATLPKEVINEIVQEIDACIALLKR